MTTLRPLLWFGRKPYRKRWAYWSGDALFLYASGTIARKVNTHGRSLWRRRIRAAVLAREWVALGVSPAPNGASGVASSWPREREDELKRVHAACAAVRCAPAHAALAQWSR